MRTLIALIAVLFVIAPASASIFVDTSPGTAAPPATLGGRTMTPYPSDARPVFEDVQGIPAPFVCTEPLCEGDPCGEIAFDIPMSHRKIGQGWATWSHGYTGDVYYSNGATSATMTFPDGPGDDCVVDAFYFYIEPNPFTLETFTVTGTDVTGATVTTTIQAHGSSGAAYVGFYTDEEQCVKIDSISVDGSSDFAWGEFGVHCCCVPEPASLALLAMGGLAVIRRNR